MSTPTREQIARTLSTCRTFEPDMCDGCDRRLREADKLLALIYRGENKDILVNGEFIIPADGGAPIRITLTNKEGESDS